ncbi:RNI-like protein [Westerdykella ornata]|uniref:RNI-like protein n=1 Tax=Westerdykella ornata TaxID=318751 RepID=A0A6A6JDB6_WESOR|nr:RNI-like protein [Westerdykella ornata]KAF2274551.1 RNI-like protein [Westerdykella ornata]
MDEAFYAGKRLSFDGQLCTVRYYGEVKGTTGKWLGVEWDEPSRGKHSGEHGGLKYFECISNNPTAGSFVRPTRKFDTPRSFVEALKAKYASEYSEDPDVQIVFVQADPNKDTLSQQNRPIRISGKEVEEVGFDKIRKQLADLHELRIVILDGLCMWRPIARLSARNKSTDADAWPSNLTDISDTCPKVTELDLSRNLFEEWREIASICEQLGKLRSLRVDSNRFRDMSLTPTERQLCMKAFENVSSLRLANTLLQWEQITDITTLFPRLTTFVASSNAYSTLSNHVLTTTITDLSLDENEFTSLSDLHPLTKLPKLQRLVLKSNKITEVACAGASLPIFSSTVTEVDLSYNEISTWSFIDKLEAVFPGLTSLRVSHNPLYQSLQAPDGRALSAEDGYMLTLARLGNLKVLNYSPISPKERLNAESYYLSLIGRELNYSPPHLESHILASHPRYAYLSSEYGVPVINRTTTAVNPNSLAARLIRFTFYLGESAKHALEERCLKHDERRFEMEIPKSCTAYTVLGIVGMYFGLPPIKCKLIWETGDWMHAPHAAETGDDSDSESTDEDSEGEEKGGKQQVMREVEIVPGTRLVGNWVEGTEAVVRVEVR